MFTIVLRKDLWSWKSNVSNISHLNTIVAVRANTKYSALTKYNATSLFETIVLCIKITSCVGMRIVGTPTSAIVLLGLQSDLAYHSLSCLKSICRHLWNSWLHSLYGQNNILTKSLSFKLEKLSNKYQSHVKTLKILNMTSFS